MSAANGTPAAAASAVLIIGSGATGLALAQGLTKAGIECIVFEKYPNLSTPSRDWNMGLHWGIPTLQALIPSNTWDRIQSVSVDPSMPVAADDALSFLQGATGEVMTSFPVPHFYRLRRSKLRSLLSEGIDVRFGKRLSGIDYSDDGASVVASFDDGTSFIGKVLVGADGARSAVRQCLLGPEAGKVTRLPYSATFVHAKYTAEQALFLRSFHPLYLASPHPSGCFAFFGMQDAPDPHRPEDWTFFFYISFNHSLETQDATADWTDARRLEQAKDLAKEYTNPWNKAFEWIPDDQPVWYLSLTAWDPGAPGHRWDTHGGRVTLAGDAAHPMTYQRGQGLNHSITDVGNLCKAIQSFLISDTSGQTEAIDKYEAEMISRAGEEVRLSIKNTSMLHHWDQVMKSPVMTAGLTKGLEPGDVKEAS